MSRYTRLLRRAPYEAVKQRSMVEAMGVEPMSALTMAPGTPCVVFIYTACITIKTRYNARDRLVILACALQSS